MGTGVGQQLEQRLVFLPLGRCFYHSMNLMAQKAGGLSAPFSCLLSSFLLAPPEHQHLHCTHTPGLVIVHDSPSCLCPCYTLFLLWFLQTPQRRRCFCDRYTEPRPCAPASF